MSAVFLDLDGTLTDSRPGIEASLRATFNEIGRDDLAATDLTWMIGPPMQESYVRAGIADIAGTLAIYRRHYNAGGLFTNSVYDGIPAMLETLRASGHRLYLATAKPHEQARRITAHFGLAPYLLAEFGPELDGTRAHKSDLLAHALEITGEKSATSVMVGDRHHDLEAAQANEMAMIAVTWGYGNPSEHEGANALCGRPGDLPATITALGL